jgi:hypothetical protein
LIKALSLSKGSSGQLRCPRGVAPRPSFRWFPVEEQGLDGGELRTRSVRAMILGMKPGACTRLHLEDQRSSILRPSLSSAFICVHLRLQPLLLSLAFFASLREKEGS